VKWDGPYFNDPIYTKEEFINEIGPKYYLNSPRRQVITYNQEIIGLVSYYFEDEPLNFWPEMGILILNNTLWGKGIGKKHFPFGLIIYFQNILRFKDLDLQHSQEIRE